jgi:tripartite-type tricarboxylate transporter receptor subunit TctC
MKIIASIALLAVSFGLQAQSYPSRPVQLLIPFGPGVNPDIMARGFAAALDPHLGRIVPVNRPGAGTALAMSALAQAPADGHTVAYAPATPITIQLHRMDNLTYTPESFIPLCQTYETAFVVTASPKVAFENFRSVVDYARANPGKLRYLTPGIATALHLAGAELWIKAGVQIGDIAFGGEAAGLTALLAGEPELAISVPGTVIAQKLRPLAVFADTRLKSMPTVPTVGEFGFTIPTSGYGGLFVRAETPPAMVARLETACREAAADPAYRKVADGQFQEINYMGREAFTARVIADYKSKAALLATLKLPR